MAEEATFDIPALIESQNMGAAVKKAEARLVADGGSPDEARMLVQLRGGACVGAGMAPLGNQGLTEPLKEAIRTLYADGFNDENWDVDFTVTLFSHTGNGVCYGVAVLEDDFPLENYRQG